MTGKTKRVSVTMDKNTPQSRKTAQKTLELKIQQAMGACPDHQCTLKELVEEYRKDQKRPLNNLHTPEIILPAMPL